VKAQNGSLQPSAEQFAAIDELANALGVGSSKLCEALELVFGEHDKRYINANQLDRELQPMIMSLHN
jgi:hypothetical protein